jgi:hypothetical protein
MAGRVASGVLIACALLAGCGGDIRQDELNRSIKQVQSAAADGQLLATGVVEDRTKATFVRAHARELTEEVDHEAEKLNDASAERALANEKQRAVDLADEVSSALGQLQISPQDQAVARKARQDLRELGDRAQRLRDEL